jgi:hypothetical protein
MPPRPAIWVPPAGIACKKKLQQEYAFCMPPRLAIWVPPAGRAKSYVAVKLSMCAQLDNFEIAKEHICHEFLMNGEEVSELGSGVGHSALHSNERRKFGIIRCFSLSASSSSISS